MINACLIGKKLGHSYSPDIHARFGYPYRNVELEEDRIEDFLKNGDYNCFNVTVPYKKTVMPFCVLSDEAKKIGAVNTIVKKDGVLYGYNTDYYGFSKLIENNGVNVADKKVVILGTGGVSAVVDYYMKTHGANVTIVGRTSANNYDNLYLHYDADVIVNCTPVGMYPDNLHSLVDLDKFKKCVFVADLIYNPYKTALLLQADKLGIKNDNGLGMLIWQAIGAAKYFCGKDFSDLYSSVYDELSIKTRNIIFIGMPSSGKSTIGKAVAQKLRRDFYDLDREIERREKRDIPTIFKESGERYFRKIENEILGELSALSGKVISLGGGAVMHPNAKDRIKQNSVCVYLKREKISTFNRPLLKNDGLNVYNKLLKEREPVYKDLADYTFDNNGSVTKVVNEIIGAIYENNRN